jgi:hypothetical protein
LVKRDPIEEIDCSRVELEFTFFSSGLPFCTRLIAIMGHETLIEVAGESLLDWLDALSAPILREADGLGVYSGAPL